MRTQRMTRTILVAMVALLMAVPANASEFTPVLDAERVYMKCHGGHRVSQAGLVQYVTWNEVEPTQSVTQGGGCVSHDTQLCCSGTVSNNNYIYDAPFFGEMHGNLDTLTVHAWVVDAGASRATSLTVDVYLAVDGVTLLDNIPITVAAPATDAARKVEFSVTGIGLLDERDVTYHDIALTMKTRSYGGSEFSWAFDATEVPTGITFNPDELAGQELKARR